MGNVYLDFRPEITSSHLEHLQRTLPNVKGHDHVVVILENQDSQESDRVVRILKEHGFDLQPKTRGEHSNEYILTAKRLLH